MRNFKIAILIGLWWICSIWANVYSKKVFFQLNDFAIQLTFAQTSTAVFIIGLLFEFQLFKDKYFSELIERISIRGIIILSFLHAFGNLFTNVSMESTNVAFTHTIKAAKPIFTIYFSRLMGKHEPFILYLATIPVMLGVVISSLAEIQFSLLGFISAVLSNSCFAY
jgi:drug/metabolite transporter (DMT)-like permease